VGTKIEKIYNAGSFVLDELSDELQDIRQNLPQPSQDPLLTQKDAQYFLARFNQIINLITRFRPRDIWQNPPQFSQDPLLTQKDVQYFLARFNQLIDLITRFRNEFVDIESTIQEIQKLYRGYGDVQGFSDIIKYFNENESTHKRIYDMEIVQRKLDFERGQMDQLMVVDREVMRVVQSLDLFRKQLVSFKERIIYLSDKKIVTQEDCQMLENVIKIVNTVKKTWDIMDKVNNNRILQIEGRN